MPTSFLDVLFTPAECDSVSFDGKAAVVIDVLRATTTMVTALANGCPEIFPVRSVEDAFSLSGQFPGNSILLGGERDGKRVDGFDLGNSPRDYTPERLEGRLLIMTTTNGTQALLKTDAAARVYAMALVNLQAVCDRLKRHQRDTLVVCAGMKGEHSLEDSVAAGLLIDRLQADDQTTWTLGEGAHQALELALTHKSDLLAMLQQSPHGAYLMSIGFGLDLDICARLNAVDLVPIYEQGAVCVFRELE